MNDTHTERLSAIRERAERGCKLLLSYYVPPEPAVEQAICKDIPYLLTLVSQLQARAEEQGRVLDNYFDTAQTWFGIHDQYELGANESEDCPAHGDWRYKKANLALEAAYLAVVDARKQPEAQQAPTQSAVVPEETQ